MEFPVRLRFVIRPLARNQNPYALCAGNSDSQIVKS